MEKEVIDHSLIILAHLQVLGLLYKDGLDDLHRTDVGVERAAEVVDHARQLIAMQLHEIEIEIIDTGDDVLRHTIHEHTHTKGFVRLPSLLRHTAQLLRSFGKGRIVGIKTPTGCNLLDITGALGPEHQPYPIDIYLAQLAHIVGRTHTTYFQYHILLNH